MAKDTRVVVYQSLEDGETGIGIYEPYTASIGRMAGG